MDFFPMNLPTHFSNTCKILLSKTWPNMGFHAVWKTTSFGLFCICLLLVFFGALPGSCTGTHGEQSIPTDSFHALRIYWPHAIVSPFPEEKSSLRSLHWRVFLFLLQSSYTLFDYVFSLSLNLWQFSCVLSVWPA